MKTYIYCSDPASVTAKRLSMWVITLCHSFEHNSDPEIALLSQISKYHIYTG
jgi:hypothetical protein